MKGKFLCYILLGVTVFSAAMLLLQPHPRPPSVVYAGAGFGKPAHRPRTLAEQGVMSSKQELELMAITSHSERSRVISDGNLGLLIALMQSPLPFDTPPNRSAKRAAFNLCLLEVGSFSNSQQKMLFQTARLMLTSKDAATRTLGVDLIERTRDAHARVLIQPLLTDRDVQVRTAAIHALARLM